MASRKRTHDDNVVDNPAKRGKIAESQLQTQQKNANPGCTSQIKQQIPNLEYTPEQLNDPLFPAFKRMDLDGSGRLDAHELAHVLSRMRGFPVSEEVATKLINQADKDDVCVC